MDNMKEKMKVWREMIESEKLEDALKDIQMNIRVQPDAQLNKYIFNLLWHLSQTADKCYKQNHMIGEKIAKLAKLLCSLLIEIPDDKIYLMISSLYHIVRCLISFNLYKDAADICCYLQPEKLYSPTNDAMELLAKIAYLWRIPINNIYAIDADSLSTENYNNLKSIIKYEMKMIKIAYKNYTLHLIVRINTHINNIATIDKRRDFDDFYEYILEYLTEVRLCLDKDEKYIIYRYILRIICCIMHKNINISYIKYAAKTLNKLCSYFGSLLIKDEECFQCFQQFKNLCMILLTPVENFRNDSAKNIRDLVICDKKIAQKYVYTESLKLNALTIVEIFQPMFIYWETCAELAQQKFIDTGIMLEIIRLISHISVFVMKDILDKCKVCKNKNCTVRKDLYSIVALKYKCVRFLSKLPVNTWPEKLCVLAGKLLEENITLISEMKECKCTRWSQLWTICGVLIYNIAEASEYEESAHLFSLLCTGIFRFQGVESEPNYLRIENPIFFMLQRLCTVHYTNKMYRKAMTAFALNALLTYNTQFTKFNIWVNIKKICASEKIAQLTILECLRDDKDRISEMGFTIDFSKYDLIQLCMHEARSLLKEKIPFADGVSAVLQEFRKLKPTNCQYAHMIQLLGFYLLGSEHNSSVLEYHEQTISDLRKDESNSVAILCLEVNLAFFTFVDELHTMNKQTLTEMENTKFALNASKLPEVRETKSPTVVPAYTMLNIKKDSSLMLSLEKCLKKWNELFNRETLDEIIKNWEPNLILHMLVTFGEYCRIYRHEKCEENAWELAYKLASEIGDYCTIIYVTGRSVSLRQINYNWITAAKEYATKHRDSKDQNIIRAIAIFWISLADFYFQCGKCDDAKKLLNDARSLPEISFLNNISVYLFSLYTIICNCNLYRDNIKHEDYSLYIVETLYTMGNLSQELSYKNTDKSKAENLFSYDVLFTATVDMSMRVNNLLSFREISIHLMRRMKLAQSLGAVMRTAELLKSLCYIDLSRTKLDDCEVKLQGLEHMLDIETFQLSMNLQPNPETSTYLAVSPARIVDPVRDVPQRDASPVLGKKVFDLPKFTLHENCDCYKCKNASYQYLVFASTYIRAQLYALQCHNTVALDHFHGAFKIRQKLFGEEDTVLPENRFCDEIGVKRFSWQARSYITDYVQLLIDFSYFLEANVTSKQQDASDIADLAISICKKYKLEKHPVYILAEEVLLNSAFQAMLESSGCSDFMVPQASDIDITDYVRAPPTSSACITPSIHNRYVKKPASIRRKKNPVVLNLDEITMSLSDDEEGDASSSTAAKSTKKSKSVKKNLVKRKIFEEDLSDDTNSITWEESATLDTKSTNRRTRKSNNTQTNEKLMKDKVTRKMTLSVPDIEPNLIDLVDEDVSVTAGNLDKAIEKMENLKVNSDTTKRIRRVKETSQPTVAHCNKNINRATALLKDMIISEETSVNIDSKVGTLNESPIQNEKTSEEYDGKSSTTAETLKQSTTVETLKQSTDNACASSISQNKTKRSRSTRLLVNNEVIGVRTRSSLRKMEKPS